MGVEEIMDVEESLELSADPLSFARSYQLEALESAMKRNTIVFLETGSGKTLIAIMLLRSYAHLLRKPSHFIAVFLVPQVVLVNQQAAAVEMHTDLKVGTYWGDKGVDFWDRDIWEKEIEKYEVLVMTPQILLDNLRHSFFKLSMIKVLIMDECHHARGRYPYASIMKEFYHRQLKPGNTHLPRILGMTASPIKTKGGNDELSYWKNINELETIMNSKVYTVASASVLAEYVPFSTPKFRLFRHTDIQFPMFSCLTERVEILHDEHVRELKLLDLEDSTSESVMKNLSKVKSAFEYCLSELGVWLAAKAAHSFYSNETDFFSWGNVDAIGETVIKKFCSVTYQEFSSYLPTDPNWSIGVDLEGNINEGLLTAKVVSLIELLLEYRDLKDLRCIVFVQRIITAVALQSLLSDLLPRNNNWKTKYIAGNSNHLQNQSRKKQNEIIEEFRKGEVNIIVATSILEEGLDVQSCNVVIRFDPSSTVCSFIQSRGRARKHNSEYILMVKSGDSKTHSRLQKYLASGDIMRKESLRHASHTCVPLESDMQEDFYRVESTEAIVTLSSSVSLVYFYCSRLPSDGYFKPTPRWDFNTATLYLPKSCPIKSICVEGNRKILKQIACLEACKQLHKMGALTDDLVPDIVLEEDNIQDPESQPYEDEQPCYVPVEMVGSFRPNEIYHCYLIELKSDFQYEIPVHDVVIGMKCELETDVGNMELDLQVGRGSLAVSLKYFGVIQLNPEQVGWCRRFQVTLFRILIDHKFKDMSEVFVQPHLPENVEVEYLLLPATTMDRRPLIIDWESVTSILFPCGKFRWGHNSCKSPNYLNSKSGPVCSCMIKNSLVYTPHNGYVYCIMAILDDMNGNSVLKLRNGADITYKKYFEVKHGTSLQYANQPLLKGREIFQVKNYLLSRQPKEKEQSNAYVELPPEMCSIIMSPISPSTLYSFSFVPSIMHRLESLLIAANLKRMYSDHGTQDVSIPTMKVLEALTTKKCQEKFHFESLETLGDSFLKYAACQHLFKSFQSNHEGFLSVKKDRIVSNVALCRLGCEHKIPGFIRDECFDPKTWIIPGDISANSELQEEMLCNTTKIYVSKTRNLKSKRVADVVEALIGAFLSTGGETEALKFMNWIGIKVEFASVPYVRHFQVHVEKHVNIRHLESMLNYSFRNPSLLVEALTHGSYMLPEIPTCYQRLEFLGDAVLDYLVTTHLYKEHPGMSPGLLTDMRSASVNNDCYALSAIKVGLHKHILHLSRQLHKDIAAAVQNFERLPLEATFGWDCESPLPKVLGDVIESLAGAILVDSGYNKETVFRSIRPLLEPLVTPQTVKLHPAHELNKFVQKMHFGISKPVKSWENGLASFTIEVNADGLTFKHTSTAKDKKTAKKLACKNVLKSLKEAFNSN